MDMQSQNYSLRCSKAVLRDRQGLPCSLCMSCTTAAFTKAARVHPFLHQEGHIHKRRPISSPPSFLPDSWPHRPQRRRSQSSAPSQTPVTNSCQWVWPLLSGPYRLCCFRHFRTPYRYGSDSHHSTLSAPLRQSGSSSPSCQAPCPAQAACWGLQAQGRRKLAQRRLHDTARCNAAQRSAALRTARHTRRVC